VGLPPDDLQGELNRPPDDDNEDYGGGEFPNLPPRQYAAPQQPQPPSPPRSRSASPPRLPSSRGSMYTPPVPPVIPNHSLGWQRVLPDVYNPLGFNWAPPNTEPST
jgi:hypothetical protein